ncbi:pleckstrin homology-like domain family B member 3 isoform X2 [Acipenser ruthenus]|uniref:pleckstrin homology-like domain family B member 3 isoform X2 n=1 Tax=Acipenser ruthenus TaxID=7906 RepID=UPI002740EF94|nr:pleckstrin homology-like domain family B member 3 isoform X2 [Acipenser ruthenus]
MDVQNMETMPTQSVLSPLHTSTNQNQGVKAVGVSGHQDLKKNAVEGTFRSSPSSSSSSSSSFSSNSSSGDETDNEETSSTESAQNQTARAPEDLRNASRQDTGHLQVLTLVTKLEQRFADLGQQQEELQVEMEMEVALLEGEMQMEKAELDKETELLDMLQKRLQDMEQKYQSEREKEKAKLGEEREKLEELQIRCSESRKRLETQPESQREQLRRRLHEDSDAMETALKSFEDLEFQQLERESAHEEAREAMQRQALMDISGQQHRVNQRKEQVLRLQEQVNEIRQQTEKESQKLSQGKKETFQILNMNPSRGTNGSSGLPKRRCQQNKPSDRPASVHDKDQQVKSVDVVNGSPSSAAVGTPSSPCSKHTSSPKPNQGNRGPTCNGTSRAPAQVFSNGNGLPNIADMERKLREAKAEKERLLRAREAKRQAQEEAKKKELECVEPTSTSTPKRHLETGPAPLLSLISSATFDLRAHLEASGHSVETCSAVTVGNRKCKGFLTKMGGKIKTWKKRCFVFDGEKKRLAYFSNKEETKLKGVIYFQAIEEVYYDHLRSASKSPHPKLTFCVKTYDRLFFMVAPTPEAMRIWIDVIVTATDEHCRY